MKCRNGRLRRGHEERPRTEAEEHGHDAPEGIAPHHQVASLAELQALLLG